MATATQTRLFKTCIDMAEPTRMQMVELLNSCLVDLADLTGATGSHDVRQPARRSWRKDAELRREYGLDSTLAETFPCSDPLSSIPDPHSDWDRS